MIYNIYSAAHSSAVSYVIDELNFCHMIDDDLVFFSFFMGGGGVISYKFSCT